jgi:hypothetical protein
MVELETKNFKIGSRGCNRAEHRYAANTVRPKKNLTSCPGLVDHYTSNRSSRIVKKVQTILKTFVIASPCRGQRCNLVPPFLT